MAEWLNETENSKLTAACARDAIADADRPDLTPKQKRGIVQDVLSLVQEGERAGFVLGMLDIYLRETRPGAIRASDRRRLMCQWHLLIDEFEGRYPIV